MLYEDIVLEMAREERELLARVERRIRERQLGLAWVGLDLGSPEGATGGESRVQSDQSQRRGRTDGIQESAEAQA